MAFILKKIVSVFIVPPLALIWLALIGVLISRKKKMLGQVICCFSLVLILILSTPFAGSRLVVWVQDDSVVTTVDPRAQAIVILGGGVEAFAPEYQAPNPSSSSLERIRFGAFLAKKTDLPVLVTSGDPLHAGAAEARVMQRILKNEWGIDVRWIEEESVDTAENAKFSFAILQKENINRIYLVTHALHMPRAKYLFEKAGFEAIPAPTGIAVPNEFSWHNILPSGGSFGSTSAAFKEIIGRVWACGQ